MERKTDSVALLILILVFLAASMLFVLWDSIKADTKACLDIVRAEISKGATND